jgi:hypothetical protein
MIFDAFELSRSAKVLNGYYRLTRWARPSWWKLMLERPRPGTESYWTVVFCRMRGHAGHIYYSSGLEPDDRCSRCLEEY